MSGPAGSRGRSAPLPRQPVGTGAWQPPWASPGYPTVPLDQAARVQSRILPAALLASPAATNLFCTLQRDLVTRASPPRPEEPWAAGPSLRRSRGAADAHRAWLRCLEHPTLAETMMPRVVTCSHLGHKGFPAMEGTKATWPPHQQGDGLARHPGWGRASVWAPGGILRRCRMGNY